MTVTSVSFCSGETSCGFTLSCPWAPWTRVWLSFIYTLPLGICTNRWDLPEPSLPQADEIEQSQTFLFSVWGASAPTSPLCPCAGLTWGGPCLSYKREPSPGHGTSGVALVVLSTGGGSHSWPAGNTPFLAAQATFASNNNQKRAF